MRIFVAGATGAVGKTLVPVLVASGHEVVGTTRTQAKAGVLRAMGAEAAVVDVLDRDAVMAAVMRADPDVVVHEATALSAMTGNMRRFGKEFAQTNTLRTQGTDNLLEAAKAAGAERFVAQSFAGWPAARVGGWVKSEDDPVDDNPPAGVRTTLEAIQYLEAAVTRADGIDGVVLRYGGFYGPGTSLSLDGVHAELVRKRRFPVVGSGAGRWSFIHMDDVAAATQAAIEGDATGVFNVVDDEPAPVYEWLPELAKALGAKPPRHVPVWLGRILAGELAVTMMTELRGASNAKAKRELGWKPVWPTWREGFRHGLAGPPRQLAAR